MPVQSKLRNSQIYEIASRLESPECNRVRSTTVLIHNGFDLAR